MDALRKRHEGPLATGAQQSRACGTATASDREPRRQFGSLSEASPEPDTVGTSVPQRGADARRRIHIGDATGRGGASTGARGPSPALKRDLVVDLPRSARGGHRPFFRASPVIGTNRTGATLQRFSPLSVRSTTTSTCSPRSGPTGATSRPPGAS